MPLGRFLKILLSALFALAVVFVVAVQYSGFQASGDIQNFAAYGQSAREYLNDARDLAIRTIAWLRNLSHDDAHFLHCPNGYFHGLPLALHLQALESR